MRAALIGLRSARWVLLGLALSSCDSEPFVGHVNHSTYFEYHNQVDEPLCPTLLPLLDSHAEMIGDKLDISLDPNDPVQYYRFQDQATLLADRRCPFDAAACAGAGTVYSAKYFHAHEQVHAFSTRAWGWSIGLLVEGVAVALSCDPATHLPRLLRPVDVVGELDWRELLGKLASTPNPNNSFAAAGFFVTHLANQYGWGQVEAFYRSVPPRASADQVEAMFTEVFSTSIDLVWQAVMNQPIAPLCQPDWVCMATELALGESASPDCDGEMHRRIEVESGGGVVLSMEGEESQLTLFSCDQPTPTRYVLEDPFGASVTVHWLSLPPGSYTMGRTRTAGPPASVTLLSQLPGPLVSEVCESATVIPLDENTTIDFTPAQLDGILRLDGGGRNYRVSPHNLWPFEAAPNPISICTDCTASSCVSVPFNGEIEITITDQSVVRFENAAALPSPSEGWAHLFFRSAP